VEQDWMPDVRGSDVGLTYGPTHPAFDECSWCGGAGEVRMGDVFRTCPACCGYGVEEDRS